MLEEELIVFSFVKAYFAFKFIKAKMDEMMGTRFVGIICYFLNNQPGKYKL